MYGTDRNTQEQAPSPAPTTGQGGTDLHVRPACAEDGPAVAAILAEAFPTMYRGTFGPLPEPEIVWLLTELYRRGHLSLEHTVVAVHSDQIVGVAILHLQGPIGRGSATDYWRLLRMRFPLFGVLRAFCGGLSTNFVLVRRIPEAPDLAYVEALAVAASARGAGVGTRLLTEAFAWGRAHGRNRIALHVLHSNTGARKLYERLGFEPWTAQPGPVSPQSLFARRPPAWSALCMLRRL